MVVGFKRTKAANGVGLRDQREIPHPEADVPMLDVPKVAS